jgi:RNA polymerase sigma factor (sigma-70 family)
MSNDGEYRIDLKVRNNLILNAIEAAGYANVAQFCKAAKLSQCRIGDFVNLKASPMGKSGEITPSAKRLCDFLGLLPEDLWTPEQLLFVLPTNKSHFSMSHKEMLLTLARHTGELLEAPDLDAGLEEEDRQRVVSEVLDSLKPQEAKVLRMRFGIGTQSDYTLDEVGAKFDVTRERVRQIETKAIRKLKEPERVKALRECANLAPRVDFDAIKQAHAWAKMNPDERAAWEEEQRKKEEARKTA